MPATAHPSLINYHSSRQGPAARANAAGRAVLDTLRLWRARSRERRAFAIVDERDLRDLGMSRWDVERELSKPFWRG
jgi:uncharacterized protein YjiS (DUF1127 family)